MITPAFVRLPIARSSRALWLGIAVLLVLPAIAMRFTPEVRWGVEDFAALAVLAGTGGLLVEAARRIMPAWPRRAAIASIGCLVVLAWALLATAG